MRTPKENIYYTILTVSVEGIKKTFENVKSLVLQTKGDSSGIIYSIFHHILVLGPTKFRKSPRAISIGRGLFSPFILLFKKSQGSQK